MYPVLKKDLAGKRGKGAAMGITWRFKVILPNFELTMSLKYPDMAILGLILQLHVACPEPPSGRFFLAIASTVGCCCFFLINRSQQMFRDRKRQDFSPACTTSISRPMNATTVHCKD